MENQDFAESPTPIQIVRALKRVPALQQEDVARDQYLGLRVHWKTRFSEVNDIGHGGLKQFGFSQRGMHRFAFMGGHPVDLWGTIHKIDMVLGMTLDPVRFQILPAGLFDRLVIRGDSQS